MTLTTQHLTQWTAGPDWQAAATDTAEHVLAESFITWGSLLRGDRLVVDIVGSYQRTNGSPLTEDLEFLIAVDGSTIHTFTATAVETATSGVGTFRCRFEIFADSPTAQRIFSRLELYNPAATGALQARQRGHVTAADFTVDRRVRYSFRKPASTSSVVTVTAVRAKLEGRST
jgi:hypothetical protein